MDSVRRDGGGRAWAFGAAFASLSAGGVQAADLPSLWAGPLLAGPLLAGPLLAGPLASTPPSDAAAPFHLVADPQSRDRATACLAAAIYYEAGGQPREGREAVAQVVLNRVRHPVYPKSVCGVVYQGAPHRGCQFTFACDGSLSRAPDTLGWRAATNLATRALDGFVAGSVGASTHYHAVWVRPSWSGALTPTRRIGAHQFYQMAGGAPSLTGVYAGAEPDIAPGLSAPALQVARFGRTQISAFAAAQRPQPSQFSVWGLEVALVTPGRGRVVVSEAPGS